MSSILARLKEPSSYAGLAAILVAAGINIDGGLLQGIIYSLSGLAGVVAFFLKEKKAA
jgi:hypothetical protein